MLNFRWPLLFHDLALAKEVVFKRPQRHTDWEDISIILSDLFSTEEKAVDIKGRACRERLDLLLKKYKEEDAKSLKRFVSQCSIVCSHHYVYVEYW